MKRPNVLFLMNDEQRADVLGFGGNKIVRTPNLDRLAQSGVIFDNAYTPSPICVPGRQALMSGQLPKTCGCNKYGEDLKPEYETFARAFAKLNYATVACGKLHHTGKDQLQGWTNRIGMDVGHAIYKDKSAGDPMFPKNKWNDTKEVKRAGVGRQGSVRDEYTVQGAINFINTYFTNIYYDRPTPDRPIMLKVSLIEPHYPYLCEEDKFNYYMNRVTPYIEDAMDHGFLGKRAVKAGVDADERELRRATAAYYGMVERCDELYGEVLTALENVGQNLDDWIIVYTTDHGEMLGQHGIWEKQKFYEASARVPLFIRWPNGFAGGRRVRENVNLCDLYATLCDLCDVDAPDGLDSRSLAPFLYDEPTTDAWNNETVSQFAGTNLMIKRDDLKYQYYGESIPEVLFDLKIDPAERINFIDDPAYADIVAAFRKRCGELGFGPNAVENYVNAGY